MIPEERLGRGALDVVANPTLGIEHTERRYADGPVIEIRDCRIEWPVAERRVTCLHVPSMAVRPAGLKRHVRYARNSYGEAGLKSRPTEGVGDYVGRGFSPGTT